MQPRAHRSRRVGVANPGDEFTAREHAFDLTAIGLEAFSKFFNETSNGSGPTWRNRALREIGARYIPIVR